jgi:selenocysteine lyase/cysteine desulfurase
MLQRGLTYLNCAAMGPTSRAVLEEVSRWSRELEANPAGEGYGALERGMDDVRVKAARLINASLPEVSLTTSVSHGMNIVAQGIDLQVGQRVLTTNQEHPSGQACWEYFARTRNAVIDVVQVPYDVRHGQEILRLFEAKITPQTRVISVSHVTSPTGIQMPVERIAQLAREHGCLCVVDGAQTVGAQPVDVKRIGCQAYAANGHKWLLGPKGTGFLFISEDARKEIDPQALQDGPNAYTKITGVANIPGMLGLGNAIDQLNSAGQTNIQKRIQELREYAYQELRKVSSVSLISPLAGELASPLLAFRIAGVKDYRSLWGLLSSKYSIVLKLVPQQYFSGALRISPHVYNNEEDIDRLIHAIKSGQG